ncbi:unnamed protein product [Urochloa humidicola]
MGKAQGRARLPLVPEQSSSGLISRVPEQRSLGYGAATPPRSFTDGGCFFNGSAGGFFNSAGQSPIAQPWTSQCSDPATWYSLSILLNFSVVDVNGVHKCSTPSLHFQFLICIL